MRRSVVPIAILAIATLGAATLVGCTSAADPTTTSSSTTTTTTEPEFTQSNVTVLVDHGGSVIDPVCDSDDTLAHVDGPTGEWGHTVLGPGTLEDGPQEVRGIQVCRHHVVFDGFPIPEDAFVVIDGISYTRVRPEDPGHYDCARWVKHFLYSNDYSLDTTSVCDI